MTDVYVAILPNEEPCGALSVRERQEEIEAVSNARVRREKYYVWRLLELAIEKSLGVSAEGLDFYKDVNGKWHCSACKISISHSAGALAVVVSDYPVGVDIERIKIKHPERACEYILTKKEMEDYRLLAEEDIEEYLISKWCQKEAAFKIFGGEHFKPSAIELDGLYLDTRRVELANEKYILVVATEKFDTVRVFEKNLGGEKWLT